MTGVNETADLVNSDELTALQNTVDKLTGDFHRLQEFFPMSSLPDNNDYRRIILGGLINSAQEFWQVDTLYRNIIQHESSDIKKICWRRMAELAKTLTDWLEVLRVAPNKSAEKLLALGKIFELAAATAFRGWTTVCQNIGCHSALYKFASKTAMSLEPTFEDFIWALTTFHVQATGIGPHEEAVLESILERNNSFGQWLILLKELPSCCRVWIGSEGMMIIFRGMFEKARIFDERLIIWKRTHVFFCHEVDSLKVVGIHNQTEKMIINEQTTFGQFRQIFAIAPSDFFDFKEKIIKMMEKIAKTLEESAEVLKMEREEAALDRSYPY